MVAPAAGVSAGRVWSGAGLGVGAGEGVACIAEEAPLLWPAVLNEAACAAWTAKNWTTMGTKHKPRAQARGTTAPRLRCRPLDLSRPPG